MASERLANSDCPRCGCNAAELVRAGTRWGRPYAVFECDHCGHEFGVGPRPRNTAGVRQIYRIPYPKLECPYCGSTNNESASSPAPKADDGYKHRYHRCLDCKENFASYEDIKR